MSTEPSDLRDPARVPVLMARPRAGHVVRLLLRDGMGLTAAGASTPFADVAAGVLAPVLGASRGG